MSEKKEFTDKHRKIVSITSIVVFILISAAVVVFVGRPLIKHISEPEKFKEWIDSFGFGADFVFIGLVILQVFFAVIPGEPFELLAGYAFGFWEGTALCLAGSVIGGILVFLFVRKFGRKAVEAFFSLEKINSLKYLKDPTSRNIIVFLLMFIPGTPKDLVGYVVGLTDMKLPAWIIISTIARIPSIVTSTLGGNALGEKKYTYAMIVFGATLVLSAAGLFAYRHISRKRSEKQKSEKNADRPEDTDGF